MSQLEMESFLGMEGVMAKNHSDTLSLWLLSIVITFGLAIIGLLVGLAFTLLQSLLSDSQLSPWLKGLGIIVAIVGSYWLAGRIVDLLKSVVVASIPGHKEAR
jgi:hypothetical protein